MLKKELLELAMLQLLQAEARYGYALIRLLHDAFPDTLESGIYAILRGLCRDGYTRSFRGETSGGPARKYYELTESGEARRRALLDRWRTLRDALEQLDVR